MAENDIYNSQGKYEKFKKTLNLLTIKPKTESTRKQYYCKNKANLEYFKRIFAVFEAKDTSYIRRLRLLQTFKLISYATEKNLAECDRNDIGKIVGLMHQHYISPKSKQDFIRDLKYLWRTLFPEVDERGRPDETIMPYVVRHLSATIDKSREKLRNDRLTWEEFEKILNYFNSDTRMQAYLFLALESLGRPQELLYIKVRDVELYDNYAKIYISEHGKEGTGFLQCIDSFPYVSKWYNEHPFKNNKDTLFFINLEGSTGRYEQIKPKNINKVLKTACERLEIKKRITAYSLKRNGVTFRRLRGDSDVEIQHAARWTSTKQLKTYDMSNQEDAFKMELVKRGIINSKDTKLEHLKPRIKMCLFCNTNNKLTNEVCSNCSRPLDREKIREQEKLKEKSYIELREELNAIKSEENKKSLEVVNNFFQHKEMQDLLKAVYKLQKEMDLIKR